MNREKFLIGVLGSLVLLLVVSSVGLLLKVNRQQASIEGLEASLQSAKMMALADATMGGQVEDDAIISSHSGIQVTRRASLKKMKVTCPYCKGEGRHIIGYKSQLDPEVYGCSICRGKGHALVTLKPAQEDLCPVCHGMGSVGKKEYDGIRRMDVWTATLCGTCRATGKVTHE